MKINGKEIADQIINHLKKKIKKLRHKPYLVIFLVGNTPENAIFTKAKERAIKKIGGKFELIHFRKTPDFEQFVNKLRIIAGDQKVTGVVIQKPLPPALSTESVFDYIPVQKEIEGHKKKTPFYAPIGLAVLTILKYIFKPDNKKVITNVIVDMKEDRVFFRKILKRKKIVLIGRGQTGGRPIANLLTEAKLNFINTCSKTPNSGSFYKEADIIISAVGKKVLTPDLLKPGVILINVGIRKENDRWRGDYDEDEIKDIASFYTSTPGGVGPLDIAYLMDNLVKATSFSKSSRKN